MKTTMSSERVEAFKMALNDATGILDYEVDKDEGKTCGYLLISYSNEKVDGNTVKNEIRVQHTGLEHDVISALITFLDSKDGRKMMAIGKMMNMLESVFKLRKK